MGPSRVTKEKSRQHPWVSTAPFFPSAISANSARKKGATGATNLRPEKWGPHNFQLSSKLRQEYSRKSLFHTERIGLQSCTALNSTAVGAECRAGRSLSACTDLSLRSRPS